MLKFLSRFTNLGICVFTVFLYHTSIWSQTPIVVENFTNPNALSNWTTSILRNAEQPTISSGQLNLQVNGGSDGFMGLADMVTLTPNYSGAFSNLQNKEIEFNLQELLIDSMSGHKMNVAAGGQIFIDNNNSLSVGVQGYYSGYHPNPSFPGWTYYNQWHGHIVTIGVNKNGIYTWQQIDALTIGTYSNLHFKLKYVNNAWQVLYRKDNQTTYSIYNTSFSQYTGAQFKMNFFSGDGGNTRLNGKGKWAVNYLKLSETAVTPQVWRGRVVSLNNYAEPYEALCDIVKNGYLTIPPALSNIGYYWTSYDMLDTFCVPNNFSFEVRLKTNSSTGGIDAYDTSIGLNAQGGNTGCTLMGAAWAQSYTSLVVAGQTVTSNQPWLVMNLSDWSVLKLKFYNNTVTYYYNGTQFFSAPYTGNICNMNGFGLSFKGSGVVDWVKIRNDNEELIYSEDFNSCTDFARAPSCGTVSAQITANSPCSNQPLQLTANTNATSYQWSGPNGFSSTDKNPIVQNPVSGTYTLKANTNACQSATTTTNVIVKPTPSVFLGNDTLLCSGIPLTLNAGNNTTTRWQDGSNNSTFVVRNTGDFVATVSNEFGCSAKDTINVRFSSAPIVNLGRDTTICGGSITLDAGSNGTIRWQDGSSNRQLIVTTSGRYMVNVRDAIGCTTNDTVNVVVGFPPSVNLGKDTLLCFGQTLLLNARNIGNNCVWNNNTTGQTVLASQSGKYSVTVTTADNCKASDTILIRVADVLNFSVNNLTNLACNTICSGRITASANGGIEPYKITWSNNRIGVSIDSLCIGTYTATLKDSIGCIATTRANITAPPLLKATAFVKSNYNGATISCYGKNDGQLQVSAAGGTGNIRFIWLTNPPQTDSIAKNLPVGNYQVVTTDANNCKDTTKITLTQPDSLAISWQTTDVKCFGETNGQIILSKVSGGVPTYSLSGNSLSKTDNIRLGQQFTGLKSGIYEMIIEDANQCRNTQKIIINEPIKPIISYTPDTIVKLGDDIELKISVDKPINALTKIKWLNKVSCDTCRNITIHPTTLTEYWVTVSVNGCEQKQRILVRIDKVRNIFVPSAFSPNGDNANDVFMVYAGKGVKRASNFQVFNRWGGLIYSIKDYKFDDPDSGWNGMFDGKILDPSVFVWKIDVEFEDGFQKTYSGSVSILK